MSVVIIKPSSRVYGGLQLQAGDEYSDDGHFYSWLLWTHYDKCVVGCEMFQALGRWMAGGLLVVFAGAWVRISRPLLQTQTVAPLPAALPAIAKNLPSATDWAYLHPHHSSCLLSLCQDSIPAYCSLLHPSQPNAQNGKLHHWNCRNSASFIVFILCAYIICIIPLANYTKTTQREQITWFWIIACWKTCDLIFNLTFSALIKVLVVDLILHHVSNSLCMVKWPPPMYQFIL